jgi:hypothetical protein
MGHYWGKDSFVAKFAPRNDMGVDTIIAPEWEQFNGIHKKSLYQNWLANLDKKRRRDPASGLALPMR